VCDVVEREGTAVAGISSAKLVGLHRAGKSQDESPS